MRLSFLYVKEKVQRGRGTKSKERFKDLKETS